MLARLDRLLLLRGLWQCLLLSLAICGLYIALDLVFSFDVFQRQKLAEGQSLFGFIFDYYLSRLPELCVSILAPATLGGALLAAATGLRRREVIAACAAGITPWRMHRGLVVVALLSGLLQWWCADHWVPKLNITGNDIGAFAGDRWFGSRSWRDPQTQAAWFTRRIRLPEREPIYADWVAIAPPEGGLAIAKALKQVDHHWEFVEPIWHWQGSRVQQLRAREIPASLQCFLDPEQARRALIGLNGLSSRELWYHPHPGAVAMILRRAAWALLPVLLVLHALPLFVRFAHIQALAPAALRACTAGLWPTLCLGTASYLGTASPLPLGVIWGTALGAVCLSACILALRWRL